MKKYVRLSLDDGHIPSIMVVSDKKFSCLTILTHTSNAKCFRNVTLNNIRGLAEIAVSVGGYGRHSPNQDMIKREWLTDKVLLSFS